MEATPRCAMLPGKTLDPNLRQFCETDKQYAMFDALQKHGGNRSHAAKEVGTQAGSISRFVIRLLNRAAKRGFSPAHDMTKTVPDGFMVKGVSTLYNADGAVSAQWVKSTVDAEKQRELMLETVAAMASEIPRAKKHPFAPKRTDADLLNCYVITDYHLQMLAWSEETRGDDWDIKIAEDMLVDWFTLAIAQSPPAETAVFAQLGDFLHSDGLDAVTPMNRNILDADTRFQKAVRVAIRALRRVISMMLSKHKNVHVIMAEGNHDPASSIWLREMFSALYEQEPRINVDLSPDPYYCYEHGLTSLFFHHGHRRKVANVDDVFVAKFRDVFGRTKFSYGHMGHMHHRDVKETNLMVVEQHRTLAAHDAYASRGGWISGREAQCITYSKRFGEVGRVVISPDMVKAA